jgi:hypothetical protein
MTLVRSLLVVFVGALCAAALPARQTARDLNDKIEALIAPAFQSAVAGFPCKLKERGKPKMLHWEEVDDCLNNAAAAKIDWRALSSSLSEVRDGIRGLSTAEFAAVVESALAKYTVPFEKMFTVKDEKALLPLTNSLLRFLPAGSLQDIPVFDKVGTLMGMFGGVYSYESSGSGNPYHLAQFQYADKNGEFKSAPERLLLDSFGVPWKDAKSQPGFRLPADKLQLGVR